MSLRKLPEAATLQRPQNYQAEIPADVLARWTASPQAAESSDDNVVSILDIIGEDFWTGGGVTAKRVSAALRAIGPKDIRVQINSPGGDVFEGIAIYNLLRAHKGKVSVEVLGWAASAASIIAMAGDDIRMGRGTFMMVHNVWGVVMGNRHDLSDASSLFETFDAALADIYAARTGRKLAEIQKMMDGETFMDPQKAVKEGFADAVDDKLGSEDGKATKASATQTDEHRRLMAKRQVEASLAKAGFPRSQRTEIFAELAAPRDAGRDPPAARDAGDLTDGLRRLLSSMKGTT
jgi:ATP-dependent Clp protease, protease subunit